MAYEKHKTVFSDKKSFQNYIYVLFYLENDYYVKINDRFKYN